MGFDYFPPVPQVLFLLYFFFVLLELYFLRSFIYSTFYTAVFYVYHSNSFSSGLCAVVLSKT